MPAVLHVCAERDCPVLTRRTRCDEHEQALECRRGTAASRGYDSHWRRVFRPQFIRKLIALGIPPICGAALPGGPGMGASECKARGIITGMRSGLHLDHDPPLTDSERASRTVVENALRVGLLCAQCHAGKTNRERQGR